MLALLCVAHGEADGSGAVDGPLLVFDEIDAGIGGHTARAVGEHLRALARGRQILCITHLPQVAALGAAPLHDRQGHRPSIPAATTVTALGRRRRRRRAGADAGRREDDATPPPSTPASSCGPHDAGTTRRAAPECVGGVARGRQ